MKEADEVYGSEDRQKLLILKVKVKNPIIKTRIIVCRIYDALKCGREAASVSNYKSLHSTRRHL
jgi:hypothetical protein